MTFSFIIPVYNARTYLRDCLDSLMRQDLTDCEVLLIDDGSTDGSGEICNEYADRCKVFHLENGGASHARNFGLDKAQGKYIVFIDSDDAVTEDMMQVYREAIKEPADIYHFNSYRTDKETELVRHYLTTNVKADRIALLSFRHCQPWDKIFVRSVIGDKRFDESMHLYEDFAFLLDYYRDVKRVAVSKSAVYRYFVRKGSLSAKGRKEYFESCDKIYTKIKAFAKDYGIVDLTDVHRNLLFVTTLIAARLYHKGVPSREIKSAIKQYEYYRPLMKQRYASLPDKVRKFCIKTGWISLAHHFFHY